ncbi:DNA replication and repair protein RecF [Desulfuromusa kysingii]|uniref:DNA replication and repair protein RecF n=1 Tax=Desulfuromusa kysingii TaxID=37625 RepID=A0A1H4AJJ4_9BACT|nr:DNA replication and repair protein RecF [Desulfuromusa kysingii]SEA36075.1 DNA replication and repair protein RecF [Desulfuromusa kysingii]
MYINKIEIENFRNIKKTIVEPNKKLNFFYGNNAQGKTNLIESIYFSSLYKSFRTNKNIDLINIDANIFKINLEVVNNKVSNKINITLDKKNKKNILINSKKPENNIFFRILNSIIYFPDEIIYLKSYPLYRRNLIDRSIFFINIEYINIHKKYLKCLKQRNIFLKSNNSEDDIWKEQLIEYAYLIINERLSYVSQINDYLSYLFSKNQLYEKYSIRYNEYQKGNIKDILQNKFIKNKINEIKYGYTLVGPHIDDFIFLINNNNINKYSSEGQKRSFLLSYKQAQLQIYKEKYGYYPILLFDDMGSELDFNRKTDIFNKIIEDSGQVFITTMDLPDIYNKEDKYKVFEVSNGNFSEFILE